MSGRDDITNDTDDNELLSPEAARELYEIGDGGIYRIRDDLGYDTIVVVGAFFAVFGVVCFLFIFGLGLFEFFDRLF